MDYEIESGIQIAEMLGNTPKGLSLILIQAGWSHASQSS